MGTLGRSWRGFLGACLSLWAVGPASAGLVTFGFNAEITTVFLGSPFDLPVNFAVGDTVSGRITFESGSGLPTSENGRVSEQGLDLELGIDDIKFNSSSFTIQLVDDAPPSKEHPLPGPGDLIVLGCSSLNFGDCDPFATDLGKGEPFRLRPNITLIGDAAALDGAFLPGDPAIWNRLTDSRRLLVGFDNYGVGSIGFQAQVGDFSVIPEASSLRLAALFGCLGARCFWAMRNARPNLTNL